MWNDWIKTRHQTIYRLDLFKFCPGAIFVFFLHRWSLSVLIFPPALYWRDVEINVHGAGAAVCIVSFILFQECSYGQCFPLAETCEDSAHSGPRDDLQFCWWTAPVLIAAPQWRTPQKGPHLRGMATVSSGLCPAEMVLQSYCLFPAHSLTTQSHCIFFSHRNPSVWKWEGLSACELRKLCNGSVQLQRFVDRKRLFPENCWGGRKHPSGPAAWNSTGECRPPKDLTFCRVVMCGRPTAN